MFKNYLHIPKHSILFCALILCLANLLACHTIEITTRKENRQLPANYSQNNQALVDTSNGVAKLNYRQYFVDTSLVALIDTALRNNQEMNILLAEISLRQNEIRARKGEYLPFLHLGLRGGFERASRYTRDGAVEEGLELRGSRFPDPLGNLALEGIASWEIDIWKKLHRAKKSAVLRYLATIEGRNYSATKLVSEIATTYYQLCALDAILAIIQQNTAIQQQALETMIKQKQAGVTTQLSVNRFEAQLLNTQNLQYEVCQQIIEGENHLRFLCGNANLPISHRPKELLAIELHLPSVGLPAQLLSNRADIRQAELDLAASKLDIQVARANFYPSLHLTARMGLEVFNPAYIFELPKTLIGGLLGDLLTPLINRNAIVANYKSAGARQVQAAYNYERTLLKAYTEVQNHLAQIDNYTASLDTKQKQVSVLTSSIITANKLFKSSRATYTEVLLTTREALDATLELVDIKLKQLLAKVNLYRALGGGVYSNSPK